MYVCKTICLLNTYIIFVIEWLIKRSESFYLNIADHYMNL